jgi:hypothetical protein
MREYFYRLNLVPLVHSKRNFRMRTSFSVRQIGQKLVLAGLLVATAVPFVSPAPAEAAPVLPGLTTTNVYVTYSHGPANVGAPGTVAWFRIYNTSTNTANNVQATMFTYVANADGSHHHGANFTLQAGPIAPGGYAEIPVACGADPGMYCSSYGVIAKVVGQLDTNKDDNAATKMGIKP